MVSLFEVDTNLAESFVLSGVFRGLDDPLLPPLHEQSEKGLGLLRKDLIMTNQELNEEIGNAIRSERKITNRILELINMAEARQLYLERGYSSLLVWLVKEHGYSERSAYLRLSAAALLKEIPLISQKLESGTLNLSNVSKAQTAIRLEEKTSGHVITPEQKAFAIAEISNKSGRETEKTLVGLFPSTASEVKRPVAKTINLKTTRVSFNLTDEDYAALKRITELLSHVVPDGDMGGVFTWMIRDEVKRLDPLQKKPRKTSPAGVHLSSDAEIPVERSSNFESLDSDASLACGLRKNASKASEPLTIKPTTAPSGDLLQVNKTDSNFQCPARETTKALRKNPEPSARLASLEELFAQASAETLRKQGDPWQMRYETESRPQHNSAQIKVQTIGHSPKIRSLKNQRAIPAEIRRAVILRAGDACEFSDPHTGHTCGCRIRTEIDHIIPVALGGESTLENLRVLCRPHNQFMAQKILGETVADRWRAK